MKKQIRKYILIFLTFLTALLCTVGVSTWIILSKKEVPALQPGFTPLTTTFVSAETKAIYYGGKTSITNYTITDPNGIDLKNCFTATISDTSTATANNTDKTKLTVNATITFTLKDEYKPFYQELATQTVAVSMHAVAAYTAGTTTTYYSDIDSALAAANTANTGTVYSLPLGNAVDTNETTGAKKAKTISTTTEIKSGVTLRLPYDEAKLDTDTEYITTPSDLVTKKNTGSDGKDSARWTKSAFNVTKYRVNQIFIKASHTLTNNGTIIVAGQMSGGDAMNSLNSMTAGYHGQINLGAGSVINNGSLVNGTRTSGNITCYGYIHDTSTSGTANGTAHVNSVGGEIRTVFSIVEHRGGSFYFGMVLTDPNDHTAINKTVEDAISDAVADGAEIGETSSKLAHYTPDSLLCPPFNRFYIESINCKLSVNYYTSVIGHTNLYADNQPNETDLNLIGTSDSSIIQLTNTETVIENTFNPTSKVHTLNVFGNITFNPLTISLKITKTKEAMGTKVTVNVAVHFSTKQVYFPLSNHFNVTLKPFKSGSNATVDLTNQKLKLLPGSTLTIEKGVTTTADSIAVYEDATKLNKIGNVSQRYDTTKPSAILKVNGSLSANAVGGKIQTTNSGAILNISSNSLISKEMLKSYDKRFITLTVKISIASASENLPFFPIEYYSDTDCTLTPNGKTLAANSSVVDNTTLKAGSYYAKNGAWYLKNFTVSYDTKGGSAVSNTPVSLSTSGSGYTFSASNLPSNTATSRTHYTFAGWYMDSNCTQSAIGQTIYGNTTLYAKWTADSYTLKYLYILPDGTIVDSGINNTTFNYETTSIPFPATTPPTDDNGKAYSLDGWYTSASGGTKLDSITVKTYADLALANGKEITIYAKWTDKVVYTINFVNSHNAASGGYDIISNINVEDVENLVFTPPTTANGLTTLLTAKNDNPDEKMYFNGWYIDDTFTTKYVDWAQLKALVSAENETYKRTLYAHWIEKYEVVFNKKTNNGNVNISIPNKYYYNQTLDLSDFDSLMPANDNTAYNRYFDGWYKVYNNNGTFSDKVETITVENDLTLYINWARKYELTITGNSGATTNPISYNITLYLLESQLSSTFTQYDTDAKKYDYWVTVNKCFSSWVNKPTNTTVTTLTKESFTDNVLTLQANWTTKHSIKVTSISSNCTNLTITFTNTHEKIPQSYAANTIIWIKNNESITVKVKAKEGIKVAGVGNNNPVTLSITGQTSKNNYSYSLPFVGKIYSSSVSIGAFNVTQNIEISTTNAG